MESKGMSKVLVIYDSQTGLTERMAEAVVEGARDVKNVEVELLKIGKPFSLSKLETAAAILGSPNIYHNVTPYMERFLESMKDYLKLSGKIGGVFGSYGWDRGQVLERLSAYMEAFGIRVVAPTLSIAHKMVAEPYIDDESLEKCRGLGRAVAEQLFATPTTLVSKEQEIQMLDNQVKAIQQQLDQIRKRLEELMK